MSLHNSLHLCVVFLPLSTVPSHISVTSQERPALSLMAFPSRDQDAGLEQVYRLPFIYAVGGGQPKKKLIQGLDYNLTHPQAQFGLRTFSNH